MKNRLKQIGAIVAIILVYVALRTAAASIGLFQPGKTGAFWEMLIHGGLLYACILAWEFFGYEPE